MSKIKRTIVNIDLSPAKSIWDQVDRDGFCWFKAKDSVRLGFQDSYSFASRLLGQTLDRVDLLQIRPLKGQVSYVHSNLEARFHTDQDPYLPAALQMFVCVRQAENGGETLSIDSWQLLKRIRKNDPELFYEIYRKPRLLRFNTGVCLGPTVSYRSGNLTLIHPPFLSPDDSVGRRFQDWIDRAPVNRLRLEPDDVLLSNNHRMLHSRTAFAGLDRYLIRMMIWPSKPLSCPKDLAKPARDFHARAKSLMRSHPLWIRERLGLAPMPPTAKLHGFHDRLPLPPDVTSNSKFRDLIKAYDRLCLAMPNEIDTHRRRDKAA